MANIGPPILGGAAAISGFLRFLEGTLFACTRRPPDETSTSLNRWSAPRAPAPRGREPGPTMLSAPLRGRALSARARTWSDTRPCRIACPSGRRMAGRTVRSGLPLPNVRLLLCDRLGSLASLPLRSLTGSRDPVRQKHYGRAETRSRKLHLTQQPNALDLSGLRDSDSTPTGTTASQGRVSVPRLSHGTCC